MPARTSPRSSPRVPSPPRSSAAATARRSKRRREATRRRRAASARSAHGTQQGRPGACERAWSDGRVSASARRWIPGRVWALAALQTAVTLSWMAYGYHQPRLLAHFRFDALAGILSWYLAFAGSTLAPLAGDASDRLVRRGRDRFPVVRAGVGLALASFFAMALTAHAEGGSPLRFALPFLVAIWIAGMTIFQAPALAILRDTTDAQGLPSMMAPLVVATTLPAAAWPWIDAAVARLGGSVTFLFGGIAVLGTALALGATADVRSAARYEGDSAQRGTLWQALACGLASAAVVLLVTDIVPAALAAHGGGIGSAGLAAIAGLSASVATLFAGQVG